MDFIRFLHAPLLSVLGGLIVNFVGAYLLSQYADEDSKLEIRKWRNRFAMVLIGGLIWTAFTAATTNRVPQAVIDRSVANERADVLEQQGREAREAAKKDAEKKTKEENQ